MATNATVAKDFTNFETGSCGMEITAGGSSGESKVEYPFDTEDLGVKGKVAGKIITFAARIYVPASYTGAPGIKLRDQTESTNQRQVDVNPTTRDRFVWVIASKRIVSLGTTIRLSIAARWIGSSAGSITVDPIIHVVGDLPKEGVNGAPARRAHPATRS